MMKKVITLIGGIALLASATTLSAQEETRVSKKIKAFDWLDVAVADGNQIEGGLHAYATSADILTAGAPKLKIAQVKPGMMVVLTTGDVTMPAGTYRLKTWATPTALPLVTEWVRVDNLVVADIATRDALTNLAVGTIVGVTANDAGEKAAYFWDGASFIDLSGGNTGGGFIAVGQGAVAYTSGFDTDDTAGAMNTAKVIDASVAAKKIDTFYSFEFALADGGLPFVAYPKAWNKPSFYIYHDLKEYPLSDCWTVNYTTVNGVDYQEWTADVDFTAGSGGVLTLRVR
jgi:hypothetical protein